MRRASLLIGSVAILVASVAATAGEETSLERWSTVEIREASEAAVARWRALNGDTEVDLSARAPVAYEDAREAVGNVDSGRRWDDDRERIYWIYQAERSMDYLEEAATIADHRAAIAQLDERRRSLDEERIQLEIERRARVAAAEQEAAFRRREAELAQRERELAEREAAIAASRADVAEQMALETMVTATEQVAAAEARADALQEELSATLTTLEFERTKRGPMLVLGDVLFELNGAELKAGARQRLDELYGYLAENPGIQANIEGHTDSTGNADYNLALSLRRANAVRDYLVQLGLDPAQATAEGFGMERPIAPNDSTEGRQQNRRVEIVFTNAEARAAAGSPETG
ncbi:MAG: OmpA family protein [Pseudomonadota bacterium]